MPESKTGTKSNQVVKNKSRYEKLKESNSDLVDLPELDQLEYIVGWIDEVGLYEHGMNGPIPIAWSSIYHWSVLTQTMLAHWEAIMIKDLSIAYCNQYHKSSSPNEPPPYAPVVFDRDQVSSRVLKLFRSHSKYRKKR